LQVTVIFSFPWIRTLFDSSVDRTPWTIRVSCEKKFVLEKVTTPFTTSSPPFDPVFLVALFRFFERIAPPSSTLYGIEKLPFWWGYTTLHDFFSPVPSPDAIIGPLVFPGLLPRLLWFPGRLNLNLAPPSVRARLDNFFEGILRWFLPSPLGNSKPDTPRFQQKTPKRLIFSHSSPLGFFVIAASPF